MDQVATKYFAGKSLADLTGKDYSVLQLKFADIKTIFPEPIAETGFRGANTLNPTLRNWAKDKKSKIGLKQTWENFAESFR